jgi:hypothetical protein
MATEAQPGDGTRVIGFLKSGASAAGKRMADLDLDKKLSPLLDHGKQAASSGFKAVGQVGDHAHELATQRKLWDQQRALVQEVLEVLTLQQALIEDLRGRVALLEGES